MLPKDPTIGKFTFETLTTGMYTDARAVLREYVQNSVDAIDEAVRQDIVRKPSDARIDIEIDDTNNIITVEDNGCGVSVAQAQSLLTNVGSSTKDANSNRGFRGIGRLAGMSYCDHLEFEAMAAGEDKSTVLSWNCRKIRDLIRPDSAAGQDLAGVIRESVEIKRPSKTPSMHGFRVTMKGVDPSSGLLDEEDIKGYLGQVCPVPFNRTKFPIGTDSQTGIKVAAKKKKVQISEYDIFLGNEQLYKPYKGTLTVRGQKLTTINSISTIHGRDEDGNQVYFGWLGISDFKGQIADKSVAGLRVRKGNIQIGEADLLDELFTQDRFNEWFVGEIHVISPDLIPNARRDDFQRNTAYHDFVDNLRDNLRDFSGLPSRYSSLRSEQKRIEQHEQTLKRISGSLENGILSNAEKDRLRTTLDETGRNLEAHKEKANKIRKSIGDPNVERTIKADIKKINRSLRIKDDLEVQLQKASLKLTRHLSHLPRESKKLMIQTFEIIEEELRHEAALRDRIEQRIITEILTKSKEKK